MSMKEGRLLPDQLSDHSVRRGAMNGVFSISSAFKRFTA
jgi:hypothetical protein